MVHEFKHRIYSLTLAEDVFDDIFVAKPSSMM